MGNVVVSRVAVPRESVPVPSDVAPLKNWTVPVGVPVPGLTGATVAVNVTSWPKTGELGVNVTVVVVDASATGTVTAGEVLAPKLVSPEYTAVIELLLETGRVVVGRVAAPPERVSVPSKVVPLL